MWKIFKKYLVIPNYQCHIAITVARNLHLWISKRLAFPKFRVSYTIKRSSRSGGKNDERGEAQRISLWGM
jgi:hypothetical protein